MTTSTDPNDLVPHLVPDLVPGADGATSETTSSPVPSSSIGDEVGEPPPPRPTTSSQTQDDHPQEHPVTTVSNPMRSDDNAVPHTAGLEDLIEGIRATWGPFARDAEQVIDALLGQRDAIAANRNALALKLANLRAEHVRLRAGLEALAGVTRDDRMRSALLALLAPKSETASEDGCPFNKAECDPLVNGCDGECDGPATEAALSEDWFDLVADIPVSEEVEELGLRVRDIATISRWMEPAVERILAARLVDTEVRLRGALARANDLATGWREEADRHKVQHEECHHAFERVSIALTDREALIHARWHRALEEISTEPDGPIKDHLEQHDRRLQAKALREAAQEWDDPEDREQEVIAEWLRARADRIEAGARWA